MSSEEQQAQVLVFSVLAAHAGSVLFARSFTAVASLFGYKGLNSGGLAVLKDACASKPEAVAVADDFFSEPQPSPPSAMIAPGLGDSVPSSARVGAANFGLAFAGDTGDAPSRWTFVFPQFPFLQNNKRTPVLPEEYQVRVDVAKQSAHVSTWTRYRHFRGVDGMNLRDYLNVLRVKDQFNAFTVSSDTAPTITSLLTYSIYRVRNVAQEFPGAIRWAGDSTLVSPVPPTSNWLYLLTNNIIPVLSRTDFNKISDTLHAKPGSFHYLQAVPKYEAITMQPNRDAREILYSAFVPETLKVSFTSGQLTPPSESVSKANWTRLAFTIPFPRFRADSRSGFVPNNEPAAASFTVGRAWHSSLSTAVSTEFDTKNGFASGVKLVHNPDNLSIPSTTVSFHSRKGAAARFSVAAGPLRLFVAGGLTHQGGNRFVVPKYGAGFSVDLS